MKQLLPMSSVKSSEIWKTVCGDPCSQDLACGFISFGERQQNVSWRGQDGTDQDPKPTLKKVESISILKCANTEVKCMVLL
jgi:hypothetical protein